MSELVAYKNVAIEAVKLAEERILYYFHNLPKIERKVDMSPVTQADREAEEIIINTIKKSFPDHGFLGEEYGAANDSAEFIWIIDPIDGTKNFIHGIDFFGTVLGLKYRGEIILGISNLPTLQEMLIATKEEKTTLNGKQVVVSSIASLNEAYVTVGGYTGINEYKYMDALLAVKDRAQTMKGYGDLHAYHLVATGRADVMFEPSIEAYDISAFQIIMKQAGGMFSDFKGDSTALGPTSLATNGLLHEEMVALLENV
jgi:histidinol-phosphatase